MFNVSSEEVEDKKQELGLRSEETFSGKYRCVLSRSTRLPH